MSIVHWIIIFIIKDRSGKSMEIPPKMLHDYSRNRLKCSQSISSLPDLQNQKKIADAIIKLFNPYKIY